MASGTAIAWLLLNLMPCMQTILLNLFVFFESSLGSFLLQEYSQYESGHIYVKAIKLSKMFRVLHKTGTLHAVYCTNIFAEFYEKGIFLQV